MAGASSLPDLFPTRWHPPFPNDILGKKRVACGPVLKDFGTLGNVDVHFSKEEGAVEYTKQCGGALGSEVKTHLVEQPSLPLHRYPVKGRTWSTQN